MKVLPEDEKNLPFGMNPKDPFDRMNYWNIEGLKYSMILWIFFFLFFFLMNKLILLSILMSISATYNLNFILNHFKYKRNRLKPFKYIRHRDYNYIVYYFFPIFLFLSFYYILTNYLNVSSQLSDYKEAIIKGTFAISFLVLAYLQACFLVDLVNYHKVVRLNSNKLIILFILLYITVGLSFAGFYLLYPHSLKIPNNSNTIFDTVYFSFITLATTGYGDISPNCNYAKAISIAENIVGLLLIAYVIVFIMSLKKPKI